MPALPKFPAARGSLLTLTLTACQPVGGDAPAVLPCPSTPLQGDDVVVGPIVCADQQFTTLGDGGGADLWIANNRFRVVMRHPEASVSLAGLGGGTLIDGAPWGLGDAVYEVAPLVQGAWMAVDAFDTDDGRLNLSGWLRDLPGNATGASGRATVSWRVEPDDPWLHLDGADGLWIHPLGAAQVLDGWVVKDRVVLGHDGTSVRDLGGAIRVEGATKLLLSDLSEAWSHRPGPLQTVAGLAEGASRLALYAGSDQVGLLEVAEDGTFSAVVPAAVDTVQATAPGRGPSPRVAARSSVRTAVGPTGTIELIFGWEGRPRPVHVSWSSTDGRQGVARVPPDGGGLNLGAGTYTLDLSAGPYVRSRTLLVDVLAATSTPVVTTLRRGVEPPAHVLANLGWRGARARTVRADPPDRMRDAVAAGLAYVVQTAEDDVANSEAYLNDIPEIRWTDGATLTSERGWQIDAWPWSAINRRSGHGVPRVDNRSPLDALALAWGGAAVDRKTRVDMAWMEAAQGEASSVVPDFVLLSPPSTPGFDTWKPWFDCLDLREVVRPSGPGMWLEVGDLDTYGQGDLERALTFGRVVATTGPWLYLRSEQTGPGGVLDDASLEADDTAADALPSVEVTVELQQGDARLDAISLVTGGGTVVHTITLGPEDTALHAVRVPIDRWLLAIGWSSDGEWAVTSPMWSSPLPRIPPSDSDTDSSGSP